MIKISSANSPSWPRARIISLDLGFSDDVYLVTCSDLPGWELAYARFPVDARSIGREIEEGFARQGRRVVAVLLDDDPAQPGERWLVVEGEDVNLLVSRLYQGANDHAHPVESKDW